MKAAALATVGKGVTFRDHSQAVWRMRGIGKGQTCDVLVTDETAKLMKKELASGGSACASPPIMGDVITWMLMSNMKLECMQQIQLSMQAVSQLGRRVAYRELLASSAPNQAAGAAGTGADASVPLLAHATRDRLEELFLTSMPLATPESLARALADALASEAGFPDTGCSEGSEAMAPTTAPARVKPAPTAVMALIKVGGVMEVSSSVIKIKAASWIKDDGVRGAGCVRDAGRVRGGCGVCAGGGIQGDERR